jgi:hypothetical protein
MVFYLTELIRRRGGCSDTQSVINLTRIGGDYITPVPHGNFYRDICFTGSRWPGNYKKCVQLDVLAVRLWPDLFLIVIQIVDILEIGSESSSSELK